MKKFIRFLLILFLLIALVVIYARYGGTEGLKTKEYTIETKDIAAIGRATSGIKAIKLKENDEVLKGLPIRKKEDTLAIIKNVYKDFIRNSVSICTIFLTNFILLDGSLGSAPVPSFFPV